MRNGGNDYINNNSIILSVLIALINLCIISDAKKNNNCLLLILSIWTLLFYLLRIITLNLTEFSNVFNRSDANFGDVNFALIIVIISTSVIWHALHFKKTHNRNYTLECCISSKILTKALILFWISLIIEIAAELNIPFIGPIASILNSFFLRPISICFLLLIFFYCNKDKMPKKYWYLLILSVVVFVLYRTLAGSRSGIYIILKMVLFIILVLGVRRINTNIILMGVFLLPIMLFFFIFTTYMRKIGMSDGSLSEKIAIAQLVLNNDTDIDPVMAMSEVYDRIGFLDFSVEMIKNKDHFRNVINLKNEVKSIVDNALSPGFDVFDQARMSHLVDKSYVYESNIPKSKFITLDYQSDELTLYGELFVLFFLPINFIFLFLIGYVFKKVWLSKKIQVKELDLARKAICLALFEIALSSYGLDWLVLDIISYYISYKIFQIVCIKLKPVTI